MRSSKYRWVYTQLTTTKWWNVIKITKGKNLKICRIRLLLQYWISYASFKHKQMRIWPIFAWHEHLAISSLPLFAIGANMFFSLLPHFSWIPPEWTEKTEYHLAIVKRTNERASKKKWKENCNWEPLKCVVVFLWMVYVSLPCTSRITNSTHNCKQFYDFYGFACIFSSIPVLCIIVFRVFFLICIWNSRRLVCRTATNIKSPISSHTSHIHPVGSVRAIQT